MALKWCQGKVTGRRIWADGLFTIELEADGVERFCPGQFLQVGLMVQIDGREEHIYRPYSVASPWGERLEFFVVVVPEGQLTPRLWNLKTGDEVTVSARAAGRFTLEHTPAAENLWLVATGTGLAPYIAMLRTPEPWENYKRIVVVHGVRNAADLAYADELGQRMQEHPGQLAYVPALTREEAPGALTGRIPGLVESGQLEEAAGVSLAADNSAIMLCGNPAMLDDMESVLAKRGIQRHRSKAPGQLVLERYW
jgi:ferredoxin--NADP+ reductase